VGIADVYDALTTSRPYRKPMTREAGMAEMTRYRAWWSDRVYIAFIEGQAPANEAPPAVPVTV
jgi:HD-GYP domain-containing protein (c-di-GMP phosphodiesterase class II)